MKFEKKIETELYSMNGIQYFKLDDNYYPIDSHFVYPQWITDAVSLVDFPVSAFRLSIPPRYCPMAAPSNTVLNTFGCGISRRGRLSGN